MEKLLGKKSGCGAGNGKERRCNFQDPVNVYTINAYIVYGTRTEINATEVGFF